MEHNEEDKHAIEAALAFLDEWAVVDAATECSSECSSGGCGSPASFASLEVENSSDKSTYKPNPNLNRRPTTERRKEEIRLLHMELKVLKGKAEHLKLTNELQKRVRGSAIDIQGRLRSELARKEKLAEAWKEIVTRQKRLRVASEVENTQLKADVAKQRKAIASIKAVLRRLSKNRHILHDSLVSPKELFSVLMKRGTADDNLALDKLCRQMEAAYFVKTNGDLAVVCNGLQLVPGKQIVEVSPTKFVAMVHYTWILPFDFFQISSIVSEILNECCHKITQEVETTNNTQFHSYVIEHRFGSSSYSISTNSALRKRFTAGHVGFVFAGLSQPFMINGSSASGISLSNRGVTSFSKLSDTSSDVVLCQVDVAIQIEVEISANAEAERKAQAWNLAEAVVKSDREQFDNFVGRIESAVLQRQMGISCC